MENTSAFSINKNGVLTRFHPDPQDDLDRVIIPEGVTEIGYNAFYNLSKEQKADMHSVVIPESVTAIRGFAFCGCSGLQDITIPDGVTTIGSGAFLHCESLTSIALPESVTKIDKAAFAYCVHLASVTLPMGIKKISGEVFDGCASLQSVVIPKGVKEIGTIAFAGCAGLKSVTFPKSVREIQSGAFQDCTALQRVVFPGKALKLDKTAFEGTRPVIIAPCIPIATFPTEDKPGAICGFAALYLENAELDGEIKAGYLKYIKGQRKKLYPTAIQYEELLHLMFAEKFITRKDIDPLLEECGKQQNVTAKAAVLEYAGKNLKPVDPMKEFKL